MFRRARSFILISLFVLTTRPLTGRALNLTNDTELQLNVSSDSLVVQIQVDSPVAVSSTVTLNDLSLSNNFQTQNDIRVSPASSSSSSRHSALVSSPTTNTKPPNNSDLPSLLVAPSSSTLVLAPPTSSSISHSKVLVSLLSTTTTLSFVTDFKGAYSVPSPVATLSLNPTVLNDGSGIQTSSPLGSFPTNSGDVNASGASSSPDPGVITGKLPASINRALMPRGNLHLGIYALAGCALFLVL